jgi:ATP-binding cassette subfamily C protein CydCD
LLADDRDAHELRGDDVRRSIAWCGAWTHLFDSILRANLALAAPHVTDAKLIEGLRHAQLGGWFSRLADGLDTPSARTAAPCRAGNGSGSE